MGKRSYFCPHCHKPFTNQDGRPCTISGCLCKLQQFTAYSTRVKLLCRRCRDDRLPVLSPTPNLQTMVVSLPLFIITVHQK